MKDTIEQKASDLGYGDPMGTIMLKKEDERGQARGFLAFGEHAMEVDVDLSQLEEGLVVARPRGRAAYVLSASMFEAVQCIVAAQLDDHPQRTLLALRNMLGERDTDRFIDFLGLGGLHPDVTEVEKTGSSEGATRYQQ